MAYRHPGQLFIEQHGSLQDRHRAVDYVTRYADFLRQEAQLHTPPIDLDTLYRHFHMPTPYRAPLVDQQGILVDGEAGLILIKEDDPRARQRFTEGHELMELLFDAHNQLATAQADVPTWQGPKKEQWCDRGSAELLMPHTSFSMSLMELGISLKTARTLSQHYRTSFMSTLLHMMEYGTGSHAVVMWRWAVSQKDQKESDRTGAPAKPKMRVWWCKCSKDWAGGFIPKNKSISRPSCIIDTAMRQQSQHVVEQFTFEKMPITCRAETLPLPMAANVCVLSLLHTELRTR